MSVLALVLLGLLIVAVLVFGGITGNLVARDPGYVLLSYDGYSVETSIWFAALLLIVGYVLVRLTLYLVTRLLRSRGILSRWSASRRANSAANRTTRGLLLLAEGEWSEAQRALVAAAPNAQSPLMNYLQAARAASALGDSARLEALLDAALESTPGSRLAVGLHRAELQQASEDWEASVATLETLRESSPRHPVVQRLLVAALRRLGRFDQLADVLPALRKSKALGRAEYAQLEADTMAARLSQAPDAATLAERYEAVPKGSRNAAGVALALGTRVLDLDVDDRLAATAEGALRRAITDEGAGPMSAALLDVYGQLPAGAGDQRKALDRWRKDMPQHAQLALASARVAARDGDLTLARAELERGLAIAPDPQLSLAQAHLLAAQGDAAGAQTALTEARSGMALAPPANAAPAAESERDAEDERAGTEAEATASEAAGSGR